MLEITHMDMKKGNTRTQLIFFLALTVSLTVGAWAYNSVSPLGWEELAAYGGMGVMVVIVLVMVWRRRQSEKQGLPADDEMSKGAEKMAAAKAFHYSILLWTLLFMLTVDTGVATHVLMGGGIIGMGLLYLGLWVYYSRKGVAEDE